MLQLACFDNLGVCVFVSVSEQVKTCSAGLPVAQTGFSRNELTHTYLHVLLAIIAIAYLRHSCYIYECC